MSKAEEEFAVHLRAHKIPFEREFMFAKDIGRRWRSDFYIEPDILVEIEGGVFSGGAHTRGKHFISDCEKYNTATLMGYRVFRFVPDRHVSTGLAIEMITRAMAEPDEVKIK